MTLAGLLPEAHLQPSLRAADKWQAINELLDILAAAGALPPNLRERAHEALLARERQMSTGIGMGVAIPHAAVDGLGHVAAAFGRAPDGIEFQALDDAPVKLIFLFLVPKAEFQTHLKTLAAIARFLNQPGESAKLLAATSATAMRGILQQDAAAEL